MGLPILKVNGSIPKPIMKWAGGKTQLLKDLTERAPSEYGKYIEPFFGGGALFFNLLPKEAIIADINPELINLYKTLTTNVQEVIEALSQHQNNPDYFYSIRSLSFSDLSPIEAAARTLYLNKTCFNGLYRVNKTGHFNVPYGSYKNPKICDAEGLISASEYLKSAKIILGDYKSVLKDHACPGDFIFLDPPYLPISKYSDFKRYSKEQFYEEDQIELAEEVKRLHEIGCHIILTNSNHPLVHDLYSPFKIEVIQTKRNINSKANGRLGEDVIVTISPKKFMALQPTSIDLPSNLSKYPPTRWMGSKNKILGDIWGITRQLNFTSVLDLFSGSGVVSYMFKSQGKQVISNDYMALSSTFTKAMVENNTTKLDLKTAEHLLIEKGPVDTFVQDTFKDLYFTDEENKLIDILRANIKRIENQYEQAIALSALIRACIKKRPRGIFTYVGQRYDDGRKDLQTTLQDHFLKAVKEINSSIFDNGKKNLARRGDAMDSKLHADLVYMDPPYYSPLSDNEYVRRYHFVEGLACDWKDVEMQWHTKTKKFKSYPTPFSTQKGAGDAFDKLFHKYKDSILVISYSSNSLPTLDEMVGLLSKHKSKVEVVKIDYKYSFGTQKVGISNNKAQEYIFIGY